MNCSDISTLAPLYLSGELEPARADGFSAHLRNCPQCRRELGQDAAFDELVRTTVLAEHIDSSSIEQHVRESIKAGQRTARRWMLSAAGIAALILVSIAGYRALFSPRAIPVYAAAARDHRLEIVDRQPRKWIADRVKIEALAAAQGLPGSVVAALAPAGYRLTQGKLCRLDGRLFLHLVYANEAGNFSLFLRRPDDTPLADAGKSIHTETLAAEHVAGFEHGLLGAVIVTEQSGDAVLRLAESAAAVI